MLKVVELFSGIGAQRMALMRAGIPHEIVAVSEIDRHAIASYSAIYGDCPNLGDIRGIESLPPCDLVTYSFPCQDLSIAGRRKGMEEGTRSGLVWEVMRLLDGEKEKPEWLLMENVPQAFTAPEWPSLVGRLEAMGYRNRWAKLDSSRFGSAQKRIRAFMLSRLGRDPPELPACNPSAPLLCLRDVMEPERPDEYIRHIPLDRIRWRKATASSEEKLKVVADWDRKGLDITNRIYGNDGRSPAVLCHGGGGRDIKVFACDDGEDNLDQNIIPSKTFLNRRYYEPDGSCPCVVSSSQGRIKVIGDDTTTKYESAARIYSDECLAPTLHDLGRRGAKHCRISNGAIDDQGTLAVYVLMPRECWRLMGFPDWAYFRASKVSSKTQLYTQAGNSIVVEVLEAIFRAAFAPASQTVPRESAAAEGTQEATS